MNKSFILFLLIFNTVILSGCTTQTTTNGGTITPLFGQGRGVSITNFTSTRDSLSYKESSEIKINFRNQSRIYLFGPARQDSMTYNKS